MIMSRVQNLMTTLTLSVCLAGCGGESTGADPNDETGRAPAPAAEGCDPAVSGLVADSMRSFQGVLNIAATRGANLADVEQVTGAPDPAVYRALADALDGLNLPDEDASVFGSPDEIAAGLGRLADLLDNALAQRDDADHAAWTELQAFSKENLIRLQAGANHYFAEAGCVD